MMPKFMRKFSLFASRVSGAQRVFRRSSQGPTVLFYHGVEEQPDPEVQRLHFPLELFERQINFVRREREVVSIDDLHASIESGKPLDSRCVVLTFDDGYANNYRIVAPMMKAWKLPFTIFVNTKHISEGRRYPLYYVRAALLHTKKRRVNFPSLQKDFVLSTFESRLAATREIVLHLKRVSQETVEQLAQECRVLISAERWAELDEIFRSEEPMTWEQVVRTTEMGATIGSHCHDHCILHANQSEAEVLWQVSESKAAIERHVGECKYFAYPNGTAEDISSVAYAAVQMAGYRMAFSTIRGEIIPAADRYLAPRIFPVPDFEEFCYLLNRSGRQNEYYRNECMQSGLVGEPVAAGSK